MMHNRLLLPHLQILDGGLGEVYVTFGIFVCILNAPRENLLVWDKNITFSSNCDIKQILFCPSVLTEAVRITFSTTSYGWQPRGVTPFFNVSITSKMFNSMGTCWERRIGIVTKLQDSASISKGTLYTIVNYSHLSPPLVSWLGSDSTSTSATVVVVVVVTSFFSSGGSSSASAVVALAVMIAMVLVVVSTNDEAR